MDRSGGKLELPSRSGRLRESDKAFHPALFVLAVTPRRELRPPRLVAGLVFFAAEWVWEEKLTPTPGTAQVALKAFQSPLEIGVMCGEVTSHPNTQTPSGSVLVGCDPEWDEEVYLFYQLLNIQKLHIPASPLLRRQAVQYLSIINKLQLTKVSLLQKGKRIP